MPPVSTNTKAKNEPVWAADDKLPKPDALRADIETDVCIVGAGIAGLTTAYLLAKEGKRVVVLDDGRLAQGMTYVTTAHLSDAIDDRFTHIEFWHGAEGSRLAAESHAAAIDKIEAIARNLKIDCDFRRIDGYLFAAPVHDQQVIDDEFEAARRAGREVSMVDRAPLDAYDTGPAIRFARQGRFHPLKYLTGVAEGIRQLGGQLYANSHVDKIEPAEDGESARVTVGEHTVTAVAVVVATNSPINDRVAMHTKQAPYMTYVIGAKIAKGSVSDALYWDTLDAYHYVRVQEHDAKHDILIIGGEDHKTGQQSESDLHPHDKLEAWARDRFPIEEIAFTWGGQCMETIDGLAFIGRNPGDAKNILIATGDSGMGMTHGTIAGMLLTDLILGRENAWTSLYDPSRRTLRAAKDFVRENLNVAVQYADWVTPGELSSTDQLELGSGAVIRRGLTKIAASRDEFGRLTELTAVCPHLGCIVQWNPVETTWDCPCHGSRFHADGQVVNGPANVNLEKVRPETEKAQRPK